MDTFSSELLLELADIHTSIATHLRLAAITSDPTKRQEDFFNAQKELQRLAKTLHQAANAAEDGPWTKHIERLEAELQSKQPVQQDELFTPNGITGAELSGGDA